MKIQIFGLSTLLFSSSNFAQAQKHPDSGVSVTAQKIAECGKFEADKGAAEIVRDVLIRKTELHGHEITREEANELNTLGRRIKYLSERYDSCMNR